VSGPASHRVPAGELDVHYLEAGDGPPVVLLHGGTATAAMSWDTAFASLADRFRLVAPDARGHGGTTNPAGTLAYDRMADDVLAFVEALGLDRPALVGHSDGAQVALEFALRHPGRASTVVLSGTMSEPTPAYVAGLHEWGFTAPGEVDVAAVERSFDDVYEPTRRAHPQYTTDEAWEGYLRAIAGLWLTLPTYTDERLATIADRTLVVTGDRDDLADLAQAERLFRAIPGASLAVIPDASHGAADTPLFWQVVASFLTSVRC
jgi:pimeloyl-ACP methyl ester carboxylesterase